ncbi:MAG: MotA/TolQ/ExbB proton channel family protein [Chlamydiales bacterium]|nr:MotA/TolQ/ExbB proton channel family protein [Chlamydiales bacterium]
MRHNPLLLLGILAAFSAPLSAEEIESSPFQLISITKEDPMIIDQELPEIGELLTFDQSFPDTSDADMLQTEQAAAHKFEVSQSIENTENTGALSTSLEEEDSFEISDLERSEVFSKPVISQIDKQELFEVKPTFTQKEKAQKALTAAVTPPAKTVAQIPVSMPVHTGPMLKINLAQVFAGSPIIYSLLASLSVFALFICLYNVLSLRATSDSFVRKVRQKLLSNQYEEALNLCLKNDQLFGRVLSSAIAARKLGFAHMVETMKAEGKRATVGFWQRISLLNDIAVVAPMLGLLGTVLGMFYAFYDLNRSQESVNTLFDGLGISVGTTVAGLIVAIMAMMLHSFAKFRVVRVLTHIEDEAQSMAALMDPRTTSSSEK